MAITLQIVVTITEGKEAEAASLFTALAAESRTEPGCVRYIVAQSNDDPKQFFLYEEYTDEAALKMHGASAHFTRYFREGVQAIVAHSVRFTPLP